MTFEKGWINRQFAKLERDSQKWPGWMRREADLRSAEANNAVGVSGEPPSPPSAPVVREAAAFKAQGS